MIGRALLGRRERSERESWPVPCWRLATCDLATTAAGEVKGEGDNPNGRVCGTGPRLGVGSILVSVRPRRCVADDGEERQHETRDQWSGGVQGGSMHAVRRSVRDRAGDGAAERGGIGTDGRARGERAGVGRCPAAVDRGEGAGRQWPRCGQRGSGAGGRACGAQVRVPRAGGGGRAGALDRGHPAHHRQAGAGGIGDRRRGHRRLRRRRPPSLGRPARARAGAPVLGGPAGAALLAGPRRRRGRQYHGPGEPARGGTARACGQQVRPHCHPHPYPDAGHSHSPTSHRPTVAALALSLALAVDGDCWLPDREGG